MCVIRIDVILAGFFFSSNPPFLVPLRPPMDLSRLDFSSTVCVPGEWKLGEGFRLDANRSQPTTMAELIDSTPCDRVKSNPASRFEIPEVTQITPDVKLELAAIRLRRYAHKDKFMKSSDSNKIPTRFHIGTVVGGVHLAVGGGKESQAAGVANRKKKTGKSHLQSLLRDESVKSWLHNSIVKRTNPARPKSKHKAPKMRQ